MSGSIPSNGMLFGGMFGANALTRYSGTYIDIRQVVQDLATIAEWVEANQDFATTLLTMLPNSLEGLKPGALYWDGNTLRRADIDPSGYPSDPSTLQAGDVYFLRGLYHVV